MTALSADRNTRTRANVGARHGIGHLAEDAVIYKGALIAANASGYVVAASDAAARTILGVSEESLDNTGGDNGDLKVRYITAIEVELENDGGAIVQANLHGPCYCADDQSVTDAAGSTNNLYVGTVAEFSTTKVWVFVEEAINVGLGGGGAGGGGNVANAAVAPAVAGLGLLRIIPIDIPNAATATYEYVTPDKIEIIDVEVIKDGAGAANTIQVTDGADAAISDAIAAAVDKAITRAGTLDKAKRTLAAGASFKIVATRAAGTMAAQVFIYALARA